VWHPTPQIMRTFFKIKVSWQARSVMQWPTVPLPPRGAWPPNPQHIRLFFGSLFLMAIRKAP